MRLRTIVVETFQIVHRAEVELGQGLNVLYGPNDLGKSTLARAVRAALLVPARSAEGSAFQSWYVDAPPRVALTFSDDGGRLWRVTKTFGPSSSSELAFSKDGVTFVRDQKAREVDETLREMLQWGIPAPGGKGGPRKLPKTFLSQVLLAEQLEVDSLLGHSAAEDPVETGRARLRTALAALAEDPRFKSVLAEVHKEVDALFTPMGQHKRGRESPFVARADEVRRRTEAVDALRKAEEQASAVRLAVRELRTRTEQAIEAMGAARERRDELALDLDRNQKRAAALAHLRKVEEELALIDALRTRVHNAEQRVSSQRAALPAHEASVKEATQAEQAATADVRRAEDVKRAVTSEEGARQRELEAAQLRAADAGAESRQIALAERERLVAAAIAAQARLADAKGSVTTANEEASRTLAAESAAVEAVDAATSAEVLAQRLLAFVDLQELERRRRQSLERAREADEDERRAAAAELEADSLQAQVFALEAAMNDRRERLPTAAVLKGLDALCRKIERLEASLGGGLTVRLRGRGGVPIQVTRDGLASEAAPIDGELSVEAERAVSVDVGELLHVDVTAGAPTAVRELSSLREQWQAEGVSALQRAGVDSLESLRTAFDDLRNADDRAKGLRVEAERHRSEASTARGRARLLRDHSKENAPSEDEVARASADVGPANATLEVEAAKLSEPKRASADGLLTKRRKALEAARAKLEGAKQAARLAEYRRDESRIAFNKAEAEAASALPGGVTNLEETAATLKSEAQTVGEERARIARDLAALERAATVEVAKADEELAAARALLEKRRAELERARKACDEARSALDVEVGSLSGLQSELERRNRAEVTARCDAAREALEAFGEVPPVIESDVELATAAVRAAEQELEGRRAELHKEEGKLSGLGGSALADSLRREQEACALAKLRQEELELDADAWKLLRDTMREVENEGSAHLGKSLSVPVSKRLHELTDRYRAIRFDKDLRAQGVELPNVRPDGDTLDVLSVGLRDQIATLVRLVIAEQLRTTVILDDHLVHSDPERLAWFQGALKRAATVTQVIVLTCRPEDYVPRSELASDEPHRDLDGGAVRVIDMSRALRRFAPSDAAP